MRLAHVLVFVCLATASAPHPAAPAAAASTVPDPARVDAIVTSAMERLSIPGLSLAIARGGEIVVSRAWGLADVEARVPATPRTRYRTASVAKTLTAAAALRLAAEGRLDLEAPVQRYCPAFPGKPWPVTVRHLLVHTSGIRHYARQGESSGTEHFFTLASALAPFAGDDLLFEPGTAFGYSTYNYVVLGCVLEGAAGKPYDALMAELVYAPAGMERTGPDHHFLIVPDRARGYSTLDARDHAALPPAVQAQVRPGSLHNAPLHDTSMKRSGGGLLSTAEDLARFGVAFAAGRVVAPATRDEAWTAQTTRDGEPLATPWGPLGIGWFVRRAGDHRELYGSGGQVGGRASLYVYPEDRVVLAVMTNLTNADIVPMERELLRLMLPDLPAEEAEPAVAAAP